MRPASVEIHRGDEGQQNQRILPLGGNAGRHDTKELRDRTRSRPGKHLEEEDKKFKVKEFCVTKEGKMNMLVSPYYFKSGGTVIDWWPEDGDEGNP